MKKLWYLFLSLFLAFGIVACEDKGEIAPDPEPEPVGPTEAPRGVVSALAYERDAYQTIEVSWTDPEEEYPITQYRVIAKAAGEDNLTFDFTADDLTVVDGKQVATLEGLEQPEYDLTILVGNDYDLQKNGAQLNDVEPFTLESMVLPTITIVDKDEDKYLRITNANGVRNIFDHIEVAMKDSEGNVIFEGEAAAADEDLAAALEDMTAKNDPIDILIELAEGTELDETATYDVDYTIYAHPAVGGVLAEGTFTYEDVLDMEAEPIAVEGSAKKLSVGVEVQPLYFHFYSYGSTYLTELEQAVITVPQVYVPISEGSEQTEPLYAHYMIYTGTSETEYELYTKDVEDGKYPANGDPWKEGDTINAHEISELVPNADKDKNLYVDEWALQAINTISLEHKEYPSYVRVEAYDKYGRLVAVGQRLCPTFSVRAEQPDIQAHQPKWELLPSGDGLTYKLKASHLSAARAFARTVKWQIKDEAGDVVAEDIVEGGSASGKAPTYATLITKEWTVEAKRFIVGKKYTVDYEIDYIPVYVIPGTNDQQPLDYDPETGKFTPTPRPTDIMDTPDTHDEYQEAWVKSATGLDHDVRILRDYFRDENGNVKYRLREKDAEGNNVYEFKHESGDYRGWIAWMEKSVVLTSEELVEAGANLENELTVPEENGEPADYKIGLAVSVPKKMNTVNLSWNAIAAEDITKVVINDGGEDVVVTSDGEYAWTVSDGRASFELEGITGGPQIFVDVKVYAGEELLGEDEIPASIFTLNNWEAPEFEWRRLPDGRYKFVVKNMANVNYAFSFNIYEDVANSPKTNSTIRFYDSNNQLVQTLFATPAVLDWWSHDWSCYARWQFKMQDAWDEWVWVGNYDSKGAAQREVPATALAEGNYRIEYEIGYMVNKNGYWSTEEPNEANGYLGREVDTRPDVTVYPDACVVFPPRVKGAFVNDNRSDNVLYCENRCQMDTQDGNYGVRQMVKVFVKDGETTFSNVASTEPQMFLTASVDEGTDYIRSVFAEWDAPFNSYAGYDTWNGLKSINGMYESVKLQFPMENVDCDKIVVAYNGQTQELAANATEVVIRDLKTSPVEFTVTAYKGSNEVISKSISSGVYTLPATASGTFSATYSRENQGWTILGEDFNTTQYATWNCSFNLYEKGSDTPVFEDPITKNGNNGTGAYLSHTCRGNGWIQGSKSGHDAFHVGEGKWDQGEVFKGLKGDTEYEVRFELEVWPYIYNPNGPETDLDKPQWDLVKIMMSDDRATNYGTMKLTGTTTFTTGQGPADFEVGATAEGYQSAKIEWNALPNATGYEVYVGDKLVADGIGAGATSTVVTGLEDAASYVFTVKALGVDVTADTPETKIFTLFGYNPNFTLVREQGDAGMVWRLRMFKLAGEFGIFEKIKFDIKDPDGNVVYSEQGVNGDVGFISVHSSWVGFKATNWSEQKDAKWATGSIGGQADWRLKNADGSPIEFKYSTEYTIEYTATLTPGLCNDIQYGNGNDGGIRWGYSAMASEKASVSGTMKFTTEAEPVELVASATTPQEYQTALVSWNKIKDATGYEVYVGDKKVAEAGVDDTSVKVSGLNEAAKYAFTVKAVGTDMTATTAEVPVFTLVEVNPTLTFAHNGTGFTLSLTNVLQPTHAYIGATLDFYDGDTWIAKAEHEHAASWVTSRVNIFSFPKNAMTRTTWHWTTATTEKSSNELSEAPTEAGFEKGKTYTVKYTINFYPYINAAWTAANDAVNWGNSSNIITTKTPWPADGVKIAEVIVNE